MYDREGLEPPTFSPRGDALPLSYLPSKYMLIFHTCGYTEGLLSHTLLSVYS